MVSYNSPLIEINSAFKTSKNVYAQEVPQQFCIALESPPPFLKETQIKAAFSGGGKLVYNTGLFFADFGHLLIEEVSMNKKCHRTKGSVTERKLFVL